MGLEIFRRSHLTLIVLGILREKPLHGYGICQVVKQRSDGINELKYGALYPLLRDLEKSGIIEGKWEPNPHGPDRKLYRLTIAGEDVFAEEAAALRHLGKIAGVPGFQEIPATS